MDLKPWTALKLPDVPVQEKAEILRTVLLGAHREPGRPRRFEKAPRRVRCSLLQKQFH